MKFVIFALIAIVAIPALAGAQTPTSLTLGDVSRAHSRFADAVQSLSADCRSTAEFVIQRQCRQEFSSEIRYSEGVFNAKTRLTAYTGYSPTYITSDHEKHEGVPPNRVLVYFRNANCAIELDTATDKDSSLETRGMQLSNEDSLSVCRQPDILKLGRSIPADFKGFNPGRPLESLQNGNFAATAGATTIEVSPKSDLMS